MLLQGMRQDGLYKRLKGVYMIPFWKRCVYDTLVDYDKMCLFAGSSSTATVLVASTRLHPRPPQSAQRQIRRCASAAVR